MAAGKNPRDLFFVIIVIKADWAGYLHVNSLQWIDISYSLF
jgi:hypothetical protein